MKVPLLKNSPICKCSVRHLLNLYILKSSENFRYLLRYVSALHITHEVHRSPSRASYVKIERSIWDEGSHITKSVNKGGPDIALTTAGLAYDALRRVGASNYRTKSYLLTSLRLYHGCLRASPL